MLSTKKLNILFLIILAFTVYDRTLWSSVAFWLVDEATTMWIGLNFPLNNIPVGLISSQDIPNPNGMIYLSKFLNKFPNLWFSSYVLSLFQLSLIVLLGYFLSLDNKKLIFIIIAPLIFSICLRSTSTHFANQWVLTLVNLLFFTLLINYINKPSLKRLVLLAIPIFIAPSIYLAGITNLVAYLLCIFFILFYYPIKITLKNSYKPFFILLLIISTFFLSVWYPFIKFITVNNIEFFSANISLGDRFVEVLKVIKNFPYWSIFYGAADLSGTFKHNGFASGSSPFWSIFHFNEEERASIKEIYDGPLSNNSIFILRLISFLLTLISIFSSLILIYLFFCVLTKRYSKIINKKITIILIAMYLFVFFIMVIGAFMGSPDWIKGKRLDMQVHIFPFLLIIWFLTPWMLKISNKFEKFFKLINLSFFLSFVALNFFGGHMIYKDYTNYKGKLFSDDDIPLIHKQEAIDFIVEDWRKGSKKDNIEVGYLFIDKRYSWVDKFGEKYHSSYPNVYTRGREYDYILLRSHGLYNKQEGIQHRKKLENQYLITHHGTKLSSDNTDILELIQIGRLKIYKIRN